MTPAQVLVPALALELAPGAGAGACDAIEEIEDEYPFGVVPAMELSLAFEELGHAVRTFERTYPHVGECPGDGARTNAGGC